MSLVKFKLVSFSFLKTEWKIECFTIDVNVFKKFVVFWVNSRVCSVYLEEFFLGIHLEIKITGMERNLQDSM